MKNGLNTWQNARVCGRGAARRLADALLAALVLLPASTLGCSNQGSEFDPPPSNGATGGSGNTSGGSGNTSAGGAVTQGGSSGASTGGGTPVGGQGGSTSTGGSTSSGGTAGTDAGGGSGNTGPVCPKPAPEICHEFIANDNDRNVVNYVNEFTGVTWTAPVGDDGWNSPRSIEIVDNPSAQTGKAVLVSVHYGYRELDLVDGTMLANPTTNTVTAAVTDHANGVSGANRLPDGTTALGVKDKIRIINASGALVREFNIPTGDNLRAVTRNAATGNFWFTKTNLLYEVNDQGQIAWDGDMGVGNKGYLVWWRDGGGAYATTGEPATVIEMDADNNIINTVGGRDTFPFLDFFSGFVRLSNGNFVVAHWLGHLTTNLEGLPHLIELTPTNQEVWRWGDQTLARQITNVYVFQ